jgi:hypothetical protein
VGFRGLVRSSSEGAPALGAFRRWGFVEALVGLLLVLLVVLVALLRLLLLLLLLALLLLCCGVLLLLDGWCR